jgi:sugar fermentation stimulation protein A
VTRIRDHVPATFVERPNRFVVVAELGDGGRVEAYLPNTGRLTHLMTPGRRLILRHDGTPPRTTEYTATRAWDGCWVALEASRAAGLLAAWLLAGNPLPGFGVVGELVTEVAVAGHRLDLLLTVDHTPVWVEVKSGGRCIDGVALLSKTPSARGVAHLAALAGLASDGHAAAAVFVVQRSDARSLVVGGDAEPGWIDAVRTAHDAGVAVLAFGCDVTETEVSIRRSLPVTWR